MEKKFLNLGKELSKSQQKQVSGGSDYYMGYQACVSINAAICASHGSAGWDMQTCTAYYQQACSATGEVSAP